MLRFAIPVYIALALLYNFCLWLAPVEIPDHRRWLRGNIHTHSLWSDGDDFPEMIALDYRDRGYDFLALSDHNVLQEGERWMKLSDVQRRGRNVALSKYAARLGEAWVERRGESEAREVRLKNLPEIRRAAQTRSFLIITGEEITDEFDKKPIHINATNLAEFIPPQHGTDVRDTIRRNLQAVAAQAKKLNRPILPHLNHPNFGYAVTAEDIAHVVEEEFFEVYNGHPGVNHRGDARHPSIERMWDIANTIRVAELKAPPLYGVATDDAHNYHVGDELQRPTPGRGWVMVRSKTLTPEAIIHAMRDGDFYATSGVTLKEIRYENGELHVAVKPDGKSRYLIQFIGTMKPGDTAPPDVGKVLSSHKGDSATYKLTGNELYVRAVVRSTSPPPVPSFDGQFAEAWTQPVGWEKWLDGEKAAAHFRRHH